MLNGRPVVILDSDDVLSRCNHQMAKSAAHILGRHWAEEEISTWDFFASVGHERYPGLKTFLETEMRTKGWCASMEPFDGALEGVKRLQEIAEVHVCTSPFGGEHWEYERRLWLYEKFHIKGKHVMQGFSKFLMRGDIFVDDKPANVEAWNAYGAENKMRGVGILWDRPHNRSEAHLKRVVGWDNLVDFVKRFDP